MAKDPQASHTSPRRQTGAEPDTRTIADRIWWWVRTLAAVLIAVLAGERLQSLKDLTAFLARYESWFLAGTGTAAAFGVALFIGGLAYMAATRGQPMSQEEVVDMQRRSRRTRWYWFRGRTWGVEVHDEFSVRGMKEAWLAGTLWSNLRWRLRLIVTAGGLLMVFGGFGIIFVLAPASVKLLVGVAIIYGLIRLTWGVLRA